MKSSKQIKSNISSQGLLTISIDEVEVPEPKDGEVIIKVQATPINPSIDLKLASVLITHYHPDHCGGGMGGHSIEGIAEVLEKEPVKIFVNKHEAEGLKKVTGVSDIDLNIVDSGDHLRYFGISPFSGVLMF